MNIAIIGYGKMGKEIEKIAIERNHNISLIIDKHNTGELTVENLKNVDVAIEFTNKDVAINNYYKCFEANVPVISGSTGINKDEMAKIEKFVKENNQTFFWASNFSLGVNIFFEINKYLAKLISKFDNYNAVITEIHHTQKLDSPSGTAITIAEGIIENIPAYKSWINHETTNNNELEIISRRIGDTPGTHIVNYNSEIDQITIKHEAFGRKGFALGAVLAGEYAVNKKGVLSMKDLLEI